MTENNDETVAPSAAASEPPKSPETTTATGAADAKPVSGGAKGPSPQAGRDRFWLWALLIAGVVCAELYIYGHAGTVTVCVGVDKVVDYSRAGEQRTVESYRKIPFCAERSNLGMWSSRDEAAKDALKGACQAATRGSASEQQRCIRKDGHWTRQLSEEQVAPWDPRLYRRLLWLD